MLTDDFSPSDASLILKVLIGCLASLLWCAGLRGLIKSARVSERAEFLCNLGTGVTVYFISTVTFSWVSSRAPSPADSSSFTRSVHPAIAVAVAVGLVDLVSYLYHLCAHKLRILWALHVVHHSARHFNLSLGTRQSWLERLLITPLCYALVLIPVASLLGLSFPYLLLGHQIVYLIGFLNHTSAFDWWPAGIRAVLINPIEHRIHHGADARHFDCNYGFALRIWDKAFGTYRAPDAASRDIIVGVTEYPATFQVLAVQRQTLSELSRCGRALVRNAQPPLRRQGKDLRRA